MRFSGDAIPRKLDRPLFVRRLFDGSDVSMVFDQSTSQIYIVDGIARLVWNLCNGRRSVTAILNELNLSHPSEANGSSPTADDVELVLVDFSDRGWIVMPATCQPA
jgi:hypothetical protein